MSGRTEHQTGSGRKERKAPHSAFKKGDERINRKGRPKGSRDKLTDTKIRLIAKTGMMPLDFMTAVYRDQLYTDYDTHIADDGVTTYFTPKADAERIEVTLQQRIICATNAAPYVHKKMPVGIEVGDAAHRTITADAIAKMSSEQIEALLGLMDMLGLRASFEGFESPQLPMSALDSPESQ